MIQTSVLLSILFFHYLGDYVVQTNAMALNKHKSNTYLMRHTISYTLLWVVPTFFWFNADWIAMLSFMCLTWALHSIQDYITSRMSNACKKAKEHHKKYLVMGADQMCHYLQLIFTYIFIASNGHF